MKILITITKAEIGGAQVFVLNLAKELKRKGHDVVVAFGYGDYLPLELNLEGIKFHQFKNLKRGFSPIANILYIKELTNYVRENDFDIVHLNSTNTLLGSFSLKKLASKRRRPKTVFTVHGLSVIDGGYKKHSFLKILFKKFFSLAFSKLDKIVFVSRKNYDFAKEANILSAKTIRKSTIVYNGLDIDDSYFISQDEARSYIANKLKYHKALKEGEGKYNTIDKKTFIYGSIGRLAYPKNYEFLISTFKEVVKVISSAKLIIIGEGPERQKYEAMIKTYGLEKDVILLGEIKEASRYIKAFDAFVLPSLYEGLSISLIESRFANIASLASLVGGNEEVLGASNCFKLDDPQDFIDKLVSVHNRVDEENDSEKGSSSLEKFKSNTMAEKYLEIYALLTQN